MGVKQADTPALTALQGYDGTREGMRKLLEAIVIDKAKITDALIDRRQASATRPGAIEAGKAFAKNTGALRNSPLLAKQMDLREMLAAGHQARPDDLHLGRSRHLRAARDRHARWRSSCPTRSSIGCRAQAIRCRPTNPKESADIIRKFVRG